MRVAYVSNVDIARPTGPGVNEREFVWSLQTESAERDDQARFLIREPSTELDFAPHDATYFRPKLVKKSSFVGLRMLSTTWHLARLVRKDLKRSKIDLFVIRLDVDCILIPLFLTALRQRYVIKTLGGLHDFYDKSHGLGGEIFSWFVRKILRKVLHDAVFIDVCTRQTCDGYKAAYSLRNIGVIENAVNVERFFVMDKELCKKKCGLEGFDKIVGYAGGYPSSRGASQLVDIAPRLIERYPDSAILIIGHDSDLPALKERATKSEGAGHVIFKGIVDYADLPRYINSLDVGVALPVNEEKVRFLGNSSQKIRQYLACGVPVVCPEGTNDEILGIGLGTGVSPNDLDQVYEAICFWLDRSETEREAFRVRSHEFARSNLSTKIAYQKRYDAWNDATRRLRA